MISFLPLVEVDPVQRLRTDRLFLTYLARMRPGLRRRANYPGETVHFADDVSRSSYRFQQGLSAQRLLIGEHGGQARLRHISRARIAVSLRGLVGRAIDIGCTRRWGLWPQGGRHFCS